jgi:lysophospholipase L1-like esterase
MGSQEALSKRKWMIFSCVLLFFIVVSIIWLRPENRTAITRSKEMKLIQPANPEWLLTNGPWKKVEDPETGEVMKGWLNSVDQMQFGRRAKIETNSSFAILNQREIGGTLTIIVDGKQVINKDLDSEGKLTKIPIYKNSMGWHKIEIIYSSLSELNGLFVSEDAQVKKPAEEKEKLVVIGHSYVEGFGSSNKGLKSFTGLLGDLLGVESINQGIGRTDMNVSYPNSKKNSGLDRVQPDVIDLNPDYVLSVYGYNSSGREVEQFQKDYTNFLKAITESLPETKIFASGVISTPYYSDEDLVPKNEAIKNACATVPACTFIDLSNKWNESNYLKYMSGDKRHPNDEGHKFLAEEYAKIISPVLKK